MKNELGVSKRKLDKAFDIAHAYFWMSDDPRVIASVKRYLINRQLCAEQNVSAQKYKFTLPKLVAVICSQCVKEELRQCNDSMDKKSQANIEATFAEEGE